MKRMKRRIALPIVLLTLPLAVGSSASASATGYSPVPGVTGGSSTGGSSACVGAGAPAPATGYNPVAGVASGPSGCAAKVASGPTIVDGTPTAVESAQRPAATDEASTVPTGATGLLLLAGLALALLGFAAGRRGTSGRGT